MFTKKNNLRHARALIPVFFIVSLALTIGTIGVHAKPHAAAPNSPTDFHTVGRTANSITLGWTAPAGGADGFFIYKYNETTKVFDAYAQLSGTATSYTDSNINCNNANVSTSGDFYRLKAYNFSGALELSDWATGIQPPPPVNDELSSALDFGSAQSMNTNICNATSNEYNYDPEIPECNLNAGTNTVWYKYQEGGSNSAISFNTEGSNYDTFIAIWKSTSVLGPNDDYQNGTLTLVTCNNDAGGTPLSNVAFKTTANEIYFIEIGRYTGTAGTSATSIKTYGPPTN